MLNRFKKIRISQSSGEKTTQIFDLLQLSRKEHQYREKCLRSLREFETWKRGHSREEPALKIYSSIEGLMLRRRARESVLFYRIIREKRIRMFKEYIHRLPMRKTVFCTAS